MTGKILSFPTGAPLLDELGACLCEAADEIVDEGAISLVSAEQKRLLLEKVDRLRALINEGRVDGLVFAGQDPVTGYFFTEMCLDEVESRTELFGFMGILENLKLEISENAAMAPALTLSGLVIDPFMEPDDE